MARTLANKRPPHVEPLAHILKLSPAERMRWWSTTPVRHGGATLADPCVYCNKRSASWDHLDPKMVGGIDWMNVAPACKQCNGDRGAASLLWYLAARLTRTAGKVATMWDRQVRGIPIGRERIPPVWVPLGLADAHPFMNGRGAFGRMFT